MISDYNELRGAVRREAQWGDKLAERVIKALYVAEARVRRANLRADKYAKSQSGKQTTQETADGATQDTCACGRPIG